MNRTYFLITIVLLAFCGRFIIKSAPLIPPLEENSVIVARVDLNEDGEDDFQVFADRGRFPTLGNEEYYEVGVALRNLEPSFLLRAKQRIPFGEGELVSVSSSVYSTITGVNWIPIGSFYQTRFPGTPWTYGDPFLTSPPTFWSTETNLLIGCRFVAEDGTHFGWIHLARPDRNFLTQYDVVGYDWNPVPGEPIGAGQPPAIPLGLDVTPQGLRIHWPAAIGLANWILESADSLKPDAPWVPVLAATNGEALLDSPEAMRFFRLRRP